MIRWIPYVFVRIVFFFIAGIWVGIYFPELLSLQLSEIIFVSFTFIFCISASIISVKRLYQDVSHIKFGIGLLGLTTIFLSGYLLLISSIEINKPGHIAHVKAPIQYYRITITDPVKEKENAWKMEGRITRVRYHDAWHSAQGNVLLYFSKKGFNKPFSYGDVLIVKGTPVPVPAPSNPEEFDYKRFLSFKNIFHQHFINESQVKYIEHESPSILMGLAYRLRSWAERQLKTYVVGAREQGVIVALVLGLTDGLDDELLSAYSATGAMHVLAVSGLHVGVIYWLLLLILKPLNKKVHGKWIVAVISIIVLWSYAFVTGLSPSVLRAVTMFSFVALARAGGQRTNIYNTLAASAFALLLYNPFFIMSVGFQLSYLAVLGIVYIQPGLFRIFEPDTKAVREIWKITSVSIAAQVATFSLGLLYFHQFPNYFIISNLIVIPASTIVLVCGLVILAISFIHSVASFTGYVVTVVVKAMNGVVFFVEALPFSMIENVYVNTMQCWLLMAIAICFILLFTYRKFNYLLAAASLSIIFSAIQWNHFLNYTCDNKISIYNVSGHTAIDLMDHGHAYFLTDSLLISDEEKIRFHIRPNRLISGINSITDDKEISFVRTLRGCKLISWHSQSILQIVDSDFNIPEGIKIDYLIISNNVIRDLSAISKISFKKLILDSSNSLYYADKIMKQAGKQNIMVHSILHDGALIAKL
jgi:competence protein ComEC